MTQGEHGRLLRLPRLAIEPRAPSRFTIKRQPASWCLSTIEATHELLLASPRHRVRGERLPCLPSRGTA